MKHTILLALVILSGIGAWKSSITAKAMAEKVNHIYSLQETAELFMENTPQGDIVKTATSFKLDRSAVQILALLNGVIFLISISVAVVDLKLGLGKHIKRKPNK